MGQAGRNCLGPLGDPAGGTVEETPLAPVQQDNARLAVCGRIAPPKARG
jgi:hypothetical protein